MLQYRRNTVGAVLGRSATKLTKNYKEIIVQLLLCDTIKERVKFICLV